MVIVLVLVGLLEILGGLFVFASSRSAIHEILGVLMIGFGFLSVGLAAILHELRKLRSLKTTGQS
jgi:Na+/phosphate symporter|nr:MAG: hypothetical protein DIU57_09420 [Pseudomonadota bacterium]